MKKLLNLLASWSLLTTATMTAVACEDNKKMKSDNIEQVTGRDIANKIKQKNIVLKAGTNADLNSPETIKALKTALQKANPTLKNSDLGWLVFDHQKPLIVDGTETPLSVKTSILNPNGDNQDGNAIVILKVRVHASAAQITAKIKAPTTTIIGIPADSNTSLSSSITQTAIKNLLKSKYRLSTYDLSTISFPNASSSVLNDQEADNAVTLKITDDAQIPLEVNVTLDKVQIHRNADQIQALIKTPSDIIAIQAGSDPSLSNKNTQTAIKKALQAKFNKITNYDLSTISFPEAITTTLTNGEANNTVELAIKDDASTPKTVNETLTKVQINSTSDQIKSLIKDPNAVIALPADSNQSLSNPTTKQAVENAIKATYSLSAYDMEQITFNNPSLNLKKDEADNAIQLNITDDSTSPSPAKITLTKVRINRTASEIAGLITNPSTTIIGIPANTSVNLDSKATQQAVKQALQSQYNQLTPHDLAMISFETGVTLTANEADNTINLKITDDSGASPAPAATVTLNKVRINRTALQIQSIMNAIKDNPVNILSNSPDDISNATTQQNLKNSLKREASGLSTYDLTTLVSFSTPGQALLKNNEQDNAVTVGIKDDAKPSDNKTVNLKKVHINSTAAQLDTKVLNVIDASSTLTIAGTGPLDTNNDSVRKAVWNALAARVTTLKAYDENFITVDTNQTIYNSYNPINFTITDDQGVQRSFGCRIKTNS